MKNFLGFIFGLIALPLSGQPIAPTTDKVLVTGVGAEASIFLYDNHLFFEGWQNLPQPQFWQQIMQLSPDCALVNVGETRSILNRVCLDDWNSQSESQKEIYRKKLREKHSLPPDTRILVTSGKSHFYQFEHAIPHLRHGIEVFETECTDPWYAQAILLIESPGLAQKSNVGAHGSFQLMPEVARLMGLTVNRVKDERLDFDRSAWAAAKLIRTICIPQANQMLARHGIMDFSPTDLWYRLLVMHIYHAGGGNVSKAMQVINPQKGNMDIITALWRTEAGGFRNASQNYSQIALAAILELYNLVYSRCDRVCDVVPLNM